MKNNNKNNILIEIGTEELPYKGLKSILNNFEDSIKKQTKKLHFNYNIKKSFITPRRIAFILELNKEKINTVLKEKIKVLITSILKNITLTSRMRWYNYKTEFIRPIKWYVLLLNNISLNHSIFNVHSSNKTLSHKTLNKKIDIYDINNYELILEKNGYVICDYEKRKKLITILLKTYARKHKLNLFLKKDSIDNTTSIIEYPSLIVCNFRKTFLKIPEEIITTVLLKDHFCFLLKKNNKLTNKLIILIDTFKPNKEIKLGYEYIINTKLTELNYLYEKEKNYIKTLKIIDLKKLVLNNKLGNMYEKTLRVKKLVSFIKDKINIKNNIVVKASNFIKLDMLTKIVTEIPELNGLIYSYNIINNKIKNYLYNYNRIINNKIKKNLPHSLIPLADIIDNISSFFILNKIPTSSKDPFNLKKDAKLIIKIISKNKININLREIIRQSLFLHKNSDKNIEKNICNFIVQKVINQKDNIKINKDNYNILNYKNEINLSNNISKYKFIEKLSIFIKRIHKITEKNKISLFKKLDEKILIKDDEKILFKKINIKLKILNKLNKKKLYFECLRTFSLLEKDVTNFFNNVLILDKNITIKHNRLKLLNIIKVIAIKKSKLSFLFNNN